MSENEQNTAIAAPKEATQPFLSREDITAVFSRWRPVIENQIRKDYAGHRVGRETAIIHQKVVASSEELLLKIADMGLTPAIVMDWLEREMALCEELSNQPPATPGISQ